MQTIDTMNRKSERGFTLVELAIVMIIIGLLIGGILKGQELIANAQIAATVAQVKGIDAAATTFRDKYDAFPGDMATPATRLLSCTGACNAAGVVSDGRLVNTPVQAMASAENLAFFPQMVAADLLTGATIAGGTAAWGQGFPAAKIEGGFNVGYHNGGALGSSLSAPRGHYLPLVLTPGAAPANSTLTNTEALRIDRKMDDGISTGGTVIANLAACNYVETNEAAQCDLLIRFQN